MRVIGLTGSIGTGKSTVARLFRDEGIPVIDADRIAREVTVPGREAYGDIVRRFGADVLRTDGTIDRRKLGDVVFSDARLRAELEAITHPRIVEGIASAVKALEREGHAVALVEAALVHESGRKGLFEAVIAVRCEEAQQVGRLVARDRVTEEQARRRIAAQMSPDEKARASEFVIDNSGDLGSTRRQVRDVASRLRSGTPP